MMPSVNNVYKIIVAKRHCASYTRPLGFIPKKLTQIEFFVNLSKLGK